MSRTETRKTGGRSAVPAAQRATGARLEAIACDGCGRGFATEDGPGMIAAIKGPCPDCGSRFRLLGSGAERG